MHKFSILTVLLLGISLMAELVPAAPGQFVISPNRKTQLRFNGTPSKPEYTLNDYHGKKIAAGTLNSDGGQWSAALELPPGFYELKVDGETFGIFAIQPFSGKPDTFFAMDCAMSWLVQPQPENVRPALVELLKRSGIGLVRERMSWGEIEPAAGKWDFEGRRKNRTLRNLYKENNIELLDVIHNAPERLGYSTTHPYPVDLVTTARAFETISQANDPALIAHREVWNEPDLQGHDRFFPVADAVVYGLRRAGTGVTVAGPILSQHPSDVFLQRLIDDEQLPLFDVFTFHDYQAPEKMASTAAKYRKLLAASGAEGCPMWITESGKEWAQQPCRPTATDDARSASWNARRAVEARAAGIDAFFAFVLTYYGEGSVNYGMLDKKHTPLRSFAAYAELVRRLSHQEYAGKLKELPGYVFIRDGKATVVVMCEEAPGTMLLLPFPVSAACGIDGRALACDKNKLEWNDELLYLETTPEALKGHFTPAEPRAALRRNVRTPSAIVIDPAYEKTPLQFRAFVYQGEPAESFELPVRLWNLSDAAVEIELTLEYPAEYGNALPPLRETLTLPPARATEHTVRFPLRQFLPKNGNYLAFKLRATDKAAGTVATRTVPILVSPKLEDVLAQYSVQYQVPVGDLARWSENATPGATLKQETRDGNFLLEITFPPGTDPWTYPQQKLVATPEFARFDAVVARVRMTGAGDSRILLWQEPDVSYMTPWRRLVTDNGEWNLVIVPLSSFVAMKPENQTVKLDPAKLNQIAVGFNSRSPERQNTLEISDLYLVGGKK